MRSIIRTALSVLLSAVVCCLLLAPMLQSRGNLRAVGYYSEASESESETQVIPDPLELYYANGGPKLDSYSAVLSYYEPFYHNFLHQYYNYWDVEDSYTIRLAYELARVYNGDFPHPYLVGDYTENGEIIIRGLKVHDYNREECIWTCMGVRDVVIPDEIDGHPVTGIRAYAFADMGNVAYYPRDALRTVVIGDNVRIIGKSAFQENDRIKSVTFGKNVEEIGAQAFDDCYNLEEVQSWGESLRTIGNRAFTETDCRFLAFPDTLETIGEEAFFGTYRLTEVVIPETVQTVFASSFSFGEQLQSITVLNRNLNIAHVENERCYYRDDFVVYCYAGSTAEADAKAYGYAYVLLDEEPPTRVAGDADGDGELTLKDVTSIRRALAGWSGYEADPVFADVNDDGLVNLKDVTLLIRYLAGGWNVELK